MKFLEACLIGISLYSFLTWLYIVIIIIGWHPEWQYLNASIYIPIPNNILGDLALPISFVAFVLAVWKWKDWE